VLHYNRSRKPGLRVWAGSTGLVEDVSGVFDVPTFDAAFDIKPALQDRAERGFIKRFETRTA
jgi:hypothetical protein